MVRRLVGASVAVLLLSSVLTLTVGTEASWAAPPAAGNAGCKVTGTGKFSPQLTLAGSPGGVKFTFKATSTDCSSTATVGGVVVNITGVRVKASGFWNLPTGGSGSSCASLPADLLGTLTIQYKWTSTPAIAQTTVTTSGGTPWSVSGPVFHFVLPSGALTTSSSGSFSPVSPQAMNLTTNIVGVCGPGWGPYHTFAISGGFFNLN